MADPLYLKRKDATATIAGTALHATDVTIEYELGVDETTNLQSGGFYSDLTDIKKLTITAKYVVPTGAGPTIPQDGSYCTAVIAVTGWLTATGSVRVHTMGTGVGPRGKLEITIKAVFQESFTLA